MSAVAVVDYQVGNLYSVTKALEWVSGGAAKIEVTRDPKVISRAERVVLPGVGAFGHCADNLRAEIRKALEEAVLERRRPFLGVCVGMQLMAEYGLEFGRHQGLGWLKGKVIPLPAGAVKLPHIGWNNFISLADNHPVLEGLKVGDHAFFLHSYWLSGDSDCVLATVGHGLTFPAVVGRDNLVGVQFHPEKSQQVGLRLLANFMRWQP